MSSTHLLVTTYPAQASGNAGDMLISHSFKDLAAAAGVQGDWKTIYREDALTDEMVTQYGHRPIFLPGMSVSSESYPSLYKLRENLDEIPAGLIPFGCTWQHIHGYREDAEQTRLSERTGALLRRIVSFTGPIATRDHLAQSIMAQNGIPAITVGDCAWYHLDSVGKAMRRPTDIRKIVVTTPHNNKLGAQSIHLMDKLTELFPSAFLTLSLQSKATAHLAPVIDHAKTKGHEIIEAAGDVTVFDRYEDFDLHVGHRLHGHIGFIRRRIPSVLLVEDARSRGFSVSIPVGCFDAKKALIGKEALSQLPIDAARQYVVPDAQAVDRVADFLAQEIETCFLRYAGVPAFLDGMLNEVVLPTLRDKVRLAGLALKRSK